MAQFKILTPYPGTPLFKRMEPTITETDWERFDGYTPTFQHPTMTHDEMRFLLGSAYTQFYMRPSFLSNYLRISAAPLRTVIDALDSPVRRRHEREIALRNGSLTC